MLSFRKPTSGAIREFLRTQSKLDFTYTAIGATATVPPKGFAVDHTRVKLGEGEAVFLSAKAALEDWVQFRLGWVDVYSPETPIGVGEVVAVIARAIGLWSLNTSRIIYVVDEPAAIRRFGFAYGTLASHMASGEERFLIEWDRATGEVWYDILAFSRPHRFLSRVGYPYMRRIQKRFGKDSAAAMVKAAKSEAQ